MFLSTSAFAENVSGEITSDTWTYANQPYYVTGDLVIPAGETLTIEPGVEVRFMGPYSLTVHGVLSASGERISSISSFSYRH